jgi:hypothetical protein
MPKHRSKWKVGDLLTDKLYPGDGYGVLVEILDLRLREPYVIECAWHGTIRMTKKEMEETVIKVA